VPDAGGRPETIMPLLKLPRISRPVHTHPILHIHRKPEMPNLKEQSEVIVMPDGSLTNIRIVKSPGMELDESIRDTLKTWKCAPATYNGKQVPTKVPIEINFRLKSKQ
jgi:TonB family protein